MRFTHFYLFGYVFIDYSCIVFWCLVVYFCLFCCFVCLLRCLIISFVVWIDCLMFCRFADYLFVVGGCLDACWLLSLWLVLVCRLVAASVGFVYLQ